MGQTSQTLKNFFWMTSEINYDVELNDFESMGSEKVLKMLKIDQKYDLTSLNLSYSDHMSMASGVEVRVPASLDFELVSFMNAFTLRLQNQKLFNNVFLERHMAGKLPAKILHRSKAGFLGCPSKLVIF